MSNPTAAMLVIGDEILSGRTRDTNTNYLAVELTNHGIQLTEARVVADDRDAIIAAVNALRAAYDTVLPAGASARPMTTSLPRRLPPPLACRSPTAPMPWRCCRRIMTAPDCLSTRRVSAWRVSPMGLR